MTEPMTEPPRTEEMTFREVFWRVRQLKARLWTERVAILRSALLLALAGAVLAFGSGSEYRAQMRVLPYRSGGGQALAGLGAIAGLNLRSGALDELITGDLYPEIAASTDFRVGLAHTPIRFSSLDTTATLAAYFSRLREPAPLEHVRRYTIGLPGLIRGGGSRGLRPSGAKGDSIPAYDREFLSVLAEIQERVDVQTDRRTGVVVVSAEMPDPYAAADVVHRAAERLMQRVVTLEAQKAREQLRFLSAQHTTIQARYQGAQRDLAHFQDRNRMLISATSNLEGERLRQERDLAYQLYQQVSTEVERARLKVSQDTPVFAVLEHPVVPASRHSPRRGALLVLFTALGGLIGALRVMARGASSAPPRGKPEGV